MIYTTSPEIHDFTSILIQWKDRIYLQIIFLIFPSWIRTIGFYTFSAIPALTNYALKPDYLL